MFYRKKGSDTTISLRNTIECPFNITYSIFGPIVQKLFIENINHSVTVINQVEDVNKNDSSLVKEFKIKNYYKGSARSSKNKRTKRYIRGFAQTIFINK